MTALDLDAAHRRELRARAHHLHPVVMIGGEGLTDSVLRETGAALDAHALIKVRILAGSRADRETILGALAERLGAAAVQHIGRLVVLWRPPPPKEKARHEDRGPGPRTVRVVKPGKSPSERPTVRNVRLLGNQRVTPGGLVKRRKTRQASPKKKLPG